MTVIAAPFYRQGDDAEYRRRSEIDPMTKSDVLGCSELIRTVNQQNFVPPLFMSIDMERMFPVRMSDDVPDGVIHSSPHNATLGYSRNSIGTVIRTISSYRSTRSKTR